MKKTIAIAAFAAAAAIGAAAGPGSGSKPCALTVERLADACGIDAAKPRFGWKISAADGATGVTQSAWRIVVSSSRARLDAGDGDMWDSGKVRSADAIDVEYGGKPLASSRGEPSAGAQDDEDDIEQVRKRLREARREVSARRRGTPPQA